MIATFRWLCSDFNLDFLFLHIFDQLVFIETFSLGLWPLIRHQAPHLRFFEFDLNFGWIGLTVLAICRDAPIIEATFILVDLCNMTFDPSGFSLAGLGLILNDF